jgi:hypothetical protein
LVRKAGNLLRRLRGYENDRGFPSLATPRLTNAALVALRAECRMQEDRFCPVAVGAVHMRLVSSGSAAIAPAPRVQVFT